jgi:hypothetical protein
MKQFASGSRTFEYLNNASVSVSVRTHIVAYNMEVCLKQKARVSATYM